MPPPPKWEALAFHTKLHLYAKGSPFGRAGRKAAWEGEDAKNYTQRIFYQQIHLDARVFVIFSGGTGHAYFSTDTAAALRAIEIQADVLLKATKVDGVYDQDPCIFKEAKKFDTLTYAQVCDGKFGVMDACAFDLCREQKMPIFIFNLNATEAIYNAVHGSLEGTLIKD